jgi:hypothetical protein
MNKYEEEQEMIDAANARYRKALYEDKITTKEGHKKLLKTIKEKGLKIPDFLKYLLEEEVSKPVSKTKEPKESKITKRQEKALETFESLLKKVSITKAEIKTVKDAIKKNKGVKIYANVPEEKLVFQFKSSVKKGSGLAFDDIVIKGKGIYNDEEESSSDEDELKGNVNFEDLPDISTMEIKDEEWRRLSIGDITFRYHLLKAYCENASDDCELPDEPEQGGLSDSAYKTKLKAFYNKQIKKPEVRELMNEAKEDEEKRPRGQGVKIKKSPKESIHIDINSHNVRDGKYMMGDGILDDSDIARLLSIMPSQSKPKNILEGIEQKDISKLFKTMELAKEGQAGQKESIEYARRALKERMEREAKSPKVDRRFTVPKTPAEVINEKVKKARQTIKKPKVKPVRKSIKGSEEMRERMARLRALKKK